ncbi:hypothetical protein ROSMUCSMR3_02744 [Roseovarius mucosus]|uniref:Uncharacterized protein n=1 Tax=Roseovarius mucosus TaxID=215743 RepID=A0A1V0RRH3_9RHOB|nr:hypothetical protein ROSMUCSMR3_02744 [Roseovarius mucosus]
MSEGSRWDAHLDPQDILLRGASNSYVPPLWRTALEIVAGLFILFLGWLYISQNAPERLDRFWGKTMALFLFFLFGVPVLYRRMRWNAGREWAITASAIHFNNRPNISIADLSHVRGWGHDVVLIRPDTGWMNVRLMKVENAAETRELLRDLIRSRKKVTV